MSLQNVGFDAFFFAINVYSGNQDWCLVHPKISLLKTTLTGFNSSTCFTDIANVVWQWYIFQHQQHFPKKHFQFVEAGQRGRHHPSKVTMMLVLVIIMRIIHVDIGIVELIKFMKHLLVSLIHSGNLKFQLSFWANEALPKRKVRGIIQSSLSMHLW